MTIAIKTKGPRSIGYTDFLLLLYFVNSVSGESNVSGGTTSARSTDIAAEVVIVSRVQLWFLRVINLCSAVQHL